MLGRLALTSAATAASISALISGVSGAPGTQHHLETGIEVLNGAHEMNDALLTRDPAHEEHIGLVRIDAVLAQHLRRFHAVVFIESMPL
jgi:hypothetical protein